MAEKEFINYMIPSASIRLRTVDMKTDRKYKDIHFHSDIEIIWVKNGIIQCQIETKNITLEGGQILFIGQDVSHKILPITKDGLFLYIQINIEQYLETFLSEDELILYTLLKNNKLSKFLLTDDNDEFANIFSKFFEEFSIKKPAYALNLQAYALNTIVYLIRKNLLPTLEKTKEKNLDLIVSILKYVKKNYSQTITLEQISKLFNMSKYHFCRFFKKTTGMALFTYINKVRLTCAEKELISTSKPIYMIALDCGFSSTTYFNSQFKKSKALSPKQFRSLFCNNDNI